MVNDDFSYIDLSDSEGNLQNQRINNLPPPQEFFQNPAGFPLSNQYPGIFNQGNYKEVIREYTSEDDNNKNDLLNKFWAVGSKSLVLGFNTPEDVKDYADMQEMARLWDIMKDTEQDFTWARGEDYRQVELLMKFRANRSVLRPNGGMNERMAQNTQISQNISTQTLKQGPLGGTGFMSQAKNAVDKILNQ